MADGVGAMALRPGTGAAVPRAALALELEGEASEVRAVLARVTAALRLAGIAEGPCGIVELVLAEALNNVAEHAYAGALPGWIRLRLETHPEAVRLELRDRGRPMPNLVLPLGRPKPLGAAGDLPEGGFGWYLIRRLAAEVAYRREAGENVLEMLVRLPGAGAD
ncbi:ATP-binding protein [Salipiger sp. H15]|uniref:ATP-binding protein n=1 Tax=Alloyangia sp. H15 TaxID=3029062 RepID=A0AAU8AI27_9RHOB